MAEQTIYSLFENNPKWTKSGGLFGGINESHKGLEAFAKYLRKRRLGNSGTLPQNIDVMNPLDFLKHLNKPDNSQYAEVAKKVEEMIHLNEMTRENFMDFATVIDGLRLMDDENFLIDKYENFLLKAKSGPSKEPHSTGRKKQQQAPTPQGQTPQGGTSKLGADIEDREKNNASIDIRNDETDTYSNEATLSDKPAESTKARKPNQPLKQEEQKNKPLNQEAPEESGAQRQSTPTEKKEPIDAPDYSRVELGGEVSIKGQVPDDKRAYKRLEKVETPRPQAKEMEYREALRGSGKALKAPKRKKGGAKRVVEVPNSKKNSGIKLGEIPRQRTSKRGAGKQEEDRLREEQMNQGAQGIPLIPISDDAMDEVSRSSRPKKQKGWAGRIGAIVGGGAAAGTMGAASAKVPAVVMTLINILF